MYCSGLPVVAAKAELNSFRKAGKSFIFPFGTFVSILRFGIFDLVDSLCKNDILWKPIKIRLSDSWF